MGIEHRDNRSFSNYIYNNFKRCDNCRIDLEENTNKLSFIEFETKLYCLKCFRNLKFLK